MDRGRNYRQTPAVVRKRKIRRGYPNRRVSNAGIADDKTGGSRPEQAANQGKARIDKRYLLHLIISLGLTVILIVSLTEIAIYFIHSHNNKVEQAALANEHQTALEQEKPETESAEAQDDMDTVARDADVAAPDVDTAAVFGTAAPSMKESAQKTATAAIGGEFFQTVGLTRDAFKSIVKQNSDAVGWITIEDIVDLPVVYRDNTYYLTHDFSGKKNSCGAIFLDVNHPIHPDSQNLLIYGHNMKDGSMFGRLIKFYKDANYLRTHYTLQFETRFNTYTYLIFAVVRVKMEISSQNFLNFAGHAAFSDADTFNRYIDEVYRQSLYTRFLDVAPTDTLITLATCLDDDRLVLLARRQRADETESDIRHDLLGLYER